MTKIIPIYSDIKHLDNCATNEQGHKFCPSCFERTGVVRALLELLYFAESVDGCTEAFKCSFCGAPCCGKRRDPRPVNKPTSKIEGDPDQSTSQSLIDQENPG